MVKEKWFWDISNLGKRWTNILDIPTPGERRTKSRISPHQGRDGQHLGHPHSRGEMDNIWDIPNPGERWTKFGSSSSLQIWYGQNLYQRQNSVTQFLFATQDGFIQNNVHNYPKYSLFIDCNLFRMNQTVSGTPDGDMNGSYQVSNSLSQIWSIFKRNIAIQTRNRKQHCYNIPYTQEGLVQIKTPHFSVFCYVLDGSLTNSMSSHLNNEYSNNEYSKVIHVQACNMHIQNVICHSLATSLKLMY